MVVAHHLHFGHHVSPHVAGGQVIFASQHVQSLNVEGRDALAHIGDGATLGHLYTGQAFQSVLQCHVAFAQERSEVVAQRVALQQQGIGPYLHLLQADALLHQHHILDSFFPAIRLQHHLFGLVTDVGKGEDGTLLQFLHAE